MEFDRQALRRHIRHQMRLRGLLAFCDDEDAAGSEELVPQPPWAPTWSQQDAAAVCTSSRSLIAHGVAATTTDHELQGIENTVLPDTEFWSSVGTQHPDVEEGLLYSLRSPACAIAYVALAVYRAHYQHGDPLYPPAGISFCVGPSPSQLQPASPVYPVRRTDALQVFPLSRAAPVASYLLVRLHGKLQKQWEDQQFYFAIRHVAAFGHAVVRPWEVPRWLGGLRACGATWGASWAARGPAPGAEEAGVAGQGPSAHEVLPSDALSGPARSIALASGMAGIPTSVMDPEMALTGFQSDGQGVRLMIPALHTVGQPEGRGQQGAARGGLGFLMALMAGGWRRAAAPPPAVDGGASDVPGPDIAAVMMGTAEVKEAAGQPSAWLLPGRRTTGSASGGVRLFYQPAALPSRQGDAGVAWQVLEYDVECLNDQGEELD